MSENGDKQRFVQDRFAIGFWVDPPADENMDARYKEIGEANFTLVLGGFGASTPDIVKRQLDLCAKYGLKALVSLPGYRTGAVKGAEALSTVDEQDRFPDHPACWGYMLKDEPNVSLFPNLRFMVDHLRKSRPGRLAYINLYPNYAVPRQLGTKTYDEHVARFVNEVDTDVLCMDHYPLMRPGADARSSYCGNLAVLRKYAGKKGIPFWNFFNTMPFGPHSDPTEAQIRWQIYTSLAYGAKGVLYFCYWTPRGGEFPKGGAIITAEGRRTRHYEQAKRINAALKNLGPTLMKLTSTNVYRISLNDGPSEIVKGSAIKSISKGDYLIGEFVHSDGRRAVLLNNYSFAYTSWPTVELDAERDRIVELNQETGREARLIDDSPAMAGFQISLDSGAGRLFLLPPAATVQ